MGRPPATRQAAQPQAIGSPAGRHSAAAVGVTLWAVILVIVALRLLLMTSATMWLWSLNLQRFLSPPVAWGLWVAMALMLLPPLASWALRTGSAAIRTLPGGSRGSAIGLGVLVALLVALFPDRTWFLGDFAIRQGAIDAGTNFVRLFPQTQPLDEFLHFSLPRALTSNGFGYYLYGRVLGVGEAALLAVMAVMFARGLSVGEAGVFAATSVVAFGGYLSLFTGYPKSAAEMVVLTVWLLMNCLRITREGRGFAGSAIALVLALALHRSALLLIPCLIAAWTLWIRHHGFRETIRRPSALVGLGTLIVGLALLVPPIVSIVRSFDLPHHFASGTVVQQGGLIRASLTPLHLLDVLNTVLVLSPIAISIPLLLGQHLSRAGRDEGLVLLALAGSFAVALVLVHPQQGLFRDWDIFGAAGAAFALLTAFLVAHWLDAVPKWAWIAAAVGASTLVPCLQLLLHSSNTDLGLRRVRAFMTEPPERPVEQQVKTWDFLGMRGARLEKWELAAEANERAVTLAPVPRIFLQWALAESEAGHWDRARAAYLHLLERHAFVPIANLGLAGAALRLGRRDEADSAMMRVREYSPNSIEARMMVEYVRRYPVVLPESLLIR